MAAQTAVRQVPHRELRPGDPVDVYLRISRDPKNDESGVHRQELAIRKLCKERGWQIAEVHVDNDISAFSGKPRPGYEAMLRRIERREIRGVVTWHPERMYRQPKELEQLIPLVQAAGVEIVTIETGEINLSTPDGRMMARFHGMMAARESEHKSARIREKMQELRREGKLTGGGRRPYGYEDDRLTIREPEAKIVRELARRRLAGESLLSLVRDLNARNIPAATGGTWTLASMSRLLRSLRIAGLRDDPEKGEPIPAPWPAIISKQEHRRLRVLLAENSRAGKRSQRSYLLTGGLVICGNCGQPMIGRPINGQPTYCCVKDEGRKRVAHGRIYRTTERTGCNKVFARATAVDEEVRRRVVEVVDKPNLLKRLKRLQGAQQPNTLDGEIERQEARLREIEGDYASGELDKAEYRRLRDQARSKLGDLNAKVEPEPILDFGDDPLGTQWPELPLGRRRAILDGLLKEVTVMPVGRVSGSKFDPDRVKVVWKV